jgi:hypothetical protein
MTAGREPLRQRRPDPVREFQHDHASLNQRILDLSALIREVERRRTTPEIRGGLRTASGELREHLFIHFSREEEGLFPYVAVALPDLTDRRWLRRTMGPAGC